MPLCLIWQGRNLSVASLALFAGWGSNHRSIPNDASKQKTRRFSVGLNTSRYLHSDFCGETSVGFHESDHYIRVGLAVRLTP